jgi:hypothetical protein
MNMHVEDPWVIVAMQDELSIGIGPFRTEAEARAWVEQNFEFGVGWWIAPFDEALPLIAVGDLQCPEEDES